MDKKVVVVLGFSLLLFLMGLGFYQGTITGSAVDAHIVVGNESGDTVGEQATTQPESIADERIVPDIQPEPSNPAVSGGLGIQTAYSSCDTISTSGDHTLSGDVNSTGTCINITASHVTLDCQGYEINYSETELGYGINITGVSNVTILGCHVTEANAATSNKYAIYLNSASLTNITSNNITTIGSGSTGIYTASSSENVFENNTINNSNYGVYIDQDNNNITSNNIIQSTSDAIQMGSGATGNRIINNVLTTGGDGIQFSTNMNVINDNNITSTTYGIFFNFASNNEISNNIITSDSVGLYLDDADDNIITANQITTTGSNDYPIHLKDTSVNNQLINNNVTSLAGTNSIQDTTGDLYINTLLYNNTFGRIAWSDASNGSFLKNLTVNVSIGLNRNIVIDNNSISVNIDNLTTLVNSSANISFYQVESITIDHLYQVPNYTISDADKITTTGTDCLGSSCTILTNLTYPYRTAHFNTTGLRSLALNGTAIDDNSAPTINTVSVNSSLATNDTDEEIYCHTNVVDAEVNQLEVYWTWYNNTTFHSNGTLLAENNTLTNIINLSSSNTGDGDNWTCGIVTSDTWTNSSQTNASVSITNTLSCAEIITTSTNMTSDIADCSGVGFNISGSDLILDCQGHSLNGTTVDSSGILVTGSNVAIHNCTVGGFSYGVDIRGNNTNLTTLNISNFSAGGIQIQASHHNYIENSSITGNTKETNAMGIDIGSSSSNTTISSNNITLVSRGINLSRSGDYNNVTRNNFFNVGVAIQHDTNAPVLDASSNWYDTDNCTLIDANITNNNFVIFDPILDDKYATGQDASCSYCGMDLRSTKTLNADLLCAGNAFTFVDNNTVLDCANYNVNSTGGSNYGLYLDTKSNVTIKNCPINNYYIGLYTSSVNFLTIVNNTFSNNTGLSWDIIDTDHSTFTNNTIEFHNHASASAIEMYTDPYNNSFTNNTIKHSQNAAFTLLGENNIFENNTLINNTIGFKIPNSGNQFFSNRLEGHSSRAFEITADNNRFANNTLEQNTVGMYFTGNYTNSTGDIFNNNSNGIAYAQDLDTFDNIFEETFFANNTVDINITGSGGSNATLINSSTFNHSLASVDVVSRLFVKWWINVNISDETGQVITGATLSSTNSILEPEPDYTTDVTGIVQATLTEYYFSADTRYFLVPSTITAHAGNFTRNSTSINIFNLTYASENLTLTAINCGDNITQDFDLGNNYSCAGTAFHINGDNVTLRGQNTILSGNTTGLGGAGINSTSNNNKIIDLLITGFDTGVLLTNAVDNNFTNVEVYNNSIVVNSTSSSSSFQQSVINGTIVADSDTELNTSLINTTFLGSISSLSSAQVLTWWYFLLNATHNNNSAPLPQATVVVFQNNSNTPLTNVVTGTDGTVLLSILEKTQNASGTTAQTPHNISIWFDVQGQNSTNETSVNLTLTNSTQAELNINLSCNAPDLDYRPTQSATLCPGTYSVDSFQISGTNDINISCLNTIFESSLTKSSLQLLILNSDNTSIEGCTFTSYQRGLTAINSDNLRLHNIDITSSTATDALYCHAGSSLSVEDSSFQEEVTLSCSSSNLLNNTFQGATGLNVIGDNNNITNNTFRADSNNLVLNRYAQNNIITYNNFTSGTIFLDASQSDNSNVFNTTVAGYPQGNTWADYCEKGKDTNGDGYADAVSSTSAADWPYNNTTSSKILGINMTDYGPLYISSCTTDVFLSSDSSSTSTTTDTGGSSLPPAAAPAAAQAPPAAGSSIYNPMDKLSTSTTQVTTTDGITTAIFTLTNTGTEPISLFPKTSRNNDFFYIVTTKTRAYQGSTASKLQSMWLPGTNIAGKLLDATIINPETLTIPPGETIEAPLQIKGGLGVSTIKVQFQLVGSSDIALEEEITVGQAVSLTAVDVDTTNQFIDLYAVIADVDNIKSTPTNKLTGAAIANQQQNSDEYMLEVAINKDGGIFGKTTIYSDLFGPYHITDKQNLVFAQQFGYDPKMYVGPHTITTKMYRGGQILVENSFEVNLK